MKYLQLRQQTSEERQESRVQYEVAQSKLLIEQHIVETQLKLEESKAKLQQLKSQFPLSPSSIIAVQGDVDGYGKGLEALVALKEELF